MTKSVSNRLTRVKGMLASVERKELQAFSGQFERAAVGGRWVGSKEDI